MASELRPGQLAWITRRQDVSPHSQAGWSWRWFEGGESLTIVRRPMIKDFPPTLRRTFYDPGNRISWARHYAQTRWVVIMGDGEQRIVREDFIVTRPGRARRS